MTNEQLRVLALQTKPLVDGSTRSLNAFYSAMSPDRTLALLDELQTAHMNGYEGGKQEARDAAHAEIDAMRQRVQELEADAKRLDWLEREAAITYGYDRTVKVAFQLNELGLAVVTLRCTVDAAMYKNGEKVDTSEPTCIEGHPV